MENEGRLTDQVALVEITSAEVDEIPSTWKGLNIFQKSGQLDTYAISKQEWEEEGARVLKRFNLWMYIDKN